MLTRCMVASALVFTTLSVHAADLTYQGKLTSAGGAANGPHDMRFTIYGQAGGGVALSSTVCIDDVDVIDGLFTVTLPLSIPTTTTGMYLDVQVRADVGNGCEDPSGFETLVPRQPITGAPVATIGQRVAEVVPIETGAVRFNATSKKLEYYDGQFWWQVATASIMIPRSTQTWTTPGTYQFTVPANVHRIWMDVHGGAGGGGARGAGLTTLPSNCQPGFGVYSVGGGGGATGSSGRFLVDVTPGEVLTITVGNGGSAGSSSVGGNGGASIIRRSNNAVDIALAPGGGGGGWQNAAVVMGTDTSAAGCVGQAPGGAGGVAGGAPTLSAGGQLVVSLAGANGGSGLGPSCEAVGDTFCSAVGGLGADGVQFLNAQQPLISQQPNAGDGAGPSNNATAGQPGVVAFWWD